MLKFAEFIQEYETNHYNDFVAYCENNNIEISEANYKDFLRNVGAGAVAASALAGGAQAADYPGPVTSALHQASGVTHQQSPHFVMHVSEKGMLTDAGGRAVNRNNLPPVFANKFGSFSKVIAGILKNTKNIDRIELVSTPQPAINIIDINGNANLVNFP